MSDTNIWNVEVSDTPPPPEIPWVPIAIIGTGGVLIVAGLLWGR